MLKKTIKFILLALCLLTALTTASAVECYTVDLSQGSKVQETGDNVNLNAANSMLTVTYTTSGGWHKAGVEFSIHDL